MLRTTKTMKEKYEQIQNYIFTLIPEKWEEIYLYASVYKEEENFGSGEMFFYYLPKGILKKKYINVYEVPRRFNINEEQYLKIVEDLFKCIKSLRQDFIDTDQEVWTNLSISIVNLKFRIEYRYDDLPKTEKEIFERNVIWKYKYLKVGGDSKEERKILESYFDDSNEQKSELYETGLYVKTENHNIGFGKEDIAERDFVMYEKDELISKASTIKSKIFSNTVYNKDKNKHAKEEKHRDAENVQSEKKSKNQILDN